VVLKPNQTMNVALRTLKSIANNKELGLTIQSVELVRRYDERQLEMVYKHDIEFDENIPKGTKTEETKQQYFRMFREGTKGPIV